jgi:hypothetical protein
MNNVGIDCGRASVSEPHYFPEITRKPGAHADDRAAEEHSPKQNG